MLDKIVSRYSKSMNISWLFVQSEEVDSHNLLLIILVIQIHKKKAASVFKVVHSRKKTHYQSRKCPLNSIILDI